MLTLLACEASDEGRVLKTEYELKHSQGGKSGTTLTLTVRVTQGLGRVEAEMVEMKPRIEGGTQEEALDKLADWMERAAKAIRERGAPVPVVSRYGS